MALVAAVAALALILLLILKWRLHAFLALLIAAVMLGLAVGMRPAAILSACQKSVGEMLGSIAVIIGAGAIMGRLIEVSGGGSVLARQIIAVLGPRRTPLALLCAAYVIGIPVFFDAAFFTLIP